MIVPLSLDALAVLDAIERRGSFAGAAVELDRVPSAITYAVRKLEDDLDVLLFDRRGHRARLTPAGRALLDEGRELLAAAGDLARRVQRVASGWEAELTVAVDAAVDFAHVLPLMAGFYRECGQLRGAHTRLRMTREVLGGTWDALAAGRADLVIGALGEPPAGGGYRLRVLAEMTTVFAVAPGHPLADAPEPLAEATVAQHRGVVAADTSRRLPVRSLHTLSAQETLTVPDLAAKLAAQLAGLCCGYLPWPLAAPQVAAGRLVVKRTEPARAPQRMHLAWRAARPGNGLAWWIEAASHADWRHLAGAPVAERAGPPLNPRRAPPRARGAARRD